MTNTISRAFPALLLLFFAATAFGQKPTAGSAPQKSLPTCNQAVAAVKKGLQGQANAECRTIFQCVECMNEKTKMKSCVNVAVQPQKSACATAANVNAEVAKTDSNNEGPGFAVEVLQSPCYAGGAALEAVVAVDGQLKPDGKMMKTEYSYLWEIDGKKGGHSPFLDCVSGQKATVIVTRLSTGKSVSRTVVLNNAAVAAKSSAKSELVAVYRKTSCYGTCPAFEAQFYADGTVSWNGIANVATKGKATKKMQPDAVSKLKDKASQVKFFDLGTHYPDYPVWDASSTVVYVNNGSKQHQVSATTGAPDGFAALVAEMESLIASNGWIAGAADVNRKEQGQQLDKQKN